MTELKQPQKPSRLSLLRRALIPLLYVSSLYILGGLTSCNVLPWFDGEFIGEADVFGVNVRYSFPHDDLNYLSNRDGTRYVGMVVYEPLERGCNVLLRRSYFDEADADSLRTVVAHEVAHCLDKYVLEHTHNGFANEGCHYGDYWCKPNEGFANFYAHYMVDLCGSLAPVGWPLEEGQEATCDALPHPSQATPEQMMLSLQKSL